MILIDTSAVILSLTGSRPALPRLEELIAEGERIHLSTLALYEWLRGPRVPAELAIQEELFPSDEALPFEPAAARLAADLYRHFGEPKGRQIDLAIAATAITAGASLWTFNDRDFRNVPDLAMIV